MYFLIRVLSLFIPPPLILTVITITTGKATGNATHTYCTLFLDSYLGGCLAVSLCLGAVHDTTQSLTDYASGFHLMLTRLFINLAAYLFSHTSPYGHYYIFKVIQWNILAGFGATELGAEFKKNEQINTLKSLPSLLFDSHSV